MPRIKGIAVEFALRNIRVVVAGQKWTVSDNQGIISSHESREAGILEASEALLMPTGASTEATPKEVPWNLIWSATEGFLAPLKPHLEPHLKSYLEQSLGTVSGATQYKHMVSSEILSHGQVSQAPEDSIMWIKFSTQYPQWAGTSTLKMVEAKQHLRLPVDLVFPV